MIGKLLLGVGLVASGVLLAVNVATATQEYVVYGRGGTTSCGTWLLEKNTANGEHNLSWVLGFVSGFGAGKNLKKTDIAGLQLFIDQYCTKNPLEDLVVATEELGRTLRQK